MQTSIVEKHTSSQLRNFINHNTCWTNIQEHSTNTHTKAKGNLSGKRSKMNIEYEISTVKGIIMHIFEENQFYLVWIWKINHQISKKPQNWRYPQLEILTTRKDNCYKLIYIQTGQGIASQIVISEFITNCKL